MGLYTRKDSPYLWYTFKLPNGKRVRGSSNTTDEKLAEAFLIEKKSEAQKVQYGFKHEKIKFKELVTDYLEIYARHFKLSYHDNIGKFRIINEHIGDLYLYEVTSAKLEEYRIKRLSERIRNAQVVKINEKKFHTVSKPTVNREMALIKHVFNKGIEWGKCSDNPARKIKFYSEKERRRVRYLEHHEKIRLLNACPTPTKRLVIFALLTGMRQAEILNLKWADVDFRMNLIHVRHSKSGKPRFVNMNSELTNMLKSIPTISEFVFGTGTGKADYTLYRKPFEKALKDSGLKDFRFHDLRHCFASDLVQKGIDLLTVAKLLGHASTQMTERYSHLSPSQLRMAVELLPRGLFSHAGVTQVFGSIEGNQNPIDLSVNAPLAQGIERLSTKLTDHPQETPEDNPSPS